MDSNAKGDNKVEIEDCPKKDANENRNGNTQMFLSFQTSEKENTCKKKMTKLNKFLNIIKCHPVRSGYKKFRSSASLSSPSIKLRQYAEGKEEISRSFASTPRCPMQGSPVHSRASTARKIDWASLWQMSKAWIRDPMNMALLVWIICVAVSGAILFMVMTGMLNHVLPKKSQRDAWFEVSNQILNALFALMCLYQHPRRFHYLFLLLRWNEKDILRLRQIYCKGGTYKPHEWIHMMIIVILLHINCFAQYALCGLNWGYRRSERPAIGVALCLCVAFSAPVAATVHNILSPLGREYDIEIDQEAQVGDKISPKGVKSLEKKFSFAIREERRVPESSPQWAGSLFDLWNDISLAYLSTFCCFCVFGWNMDRLGFGNMYVHIATFILLCVAPFLIFNMAAINIDNESVREALGFTGIILCLFGLLYGGFWRIQMRKKFNLPENKLCCGSPSMTDCMQWLCCCSCSLAQEVRTADFYEIVEDKFFAKEDGVSTPDMLLSPLHREGGTPMHRGEGSPRVISDPSSPLWGTSSPPIFKYVSSPSPKRSDKAHVDDLKLPVVTEEDSSKGGEDDTTMKPPCHPQIQKD